MGDYLKSPGHSKFCNACRTCIMRSFGSIPIAPLITDVCSVVILSARIIEARFRPILRHSGCVEANEIECPGNGAAAEEVINATIKSSGESQRAKTKHGRLLELVNP
jgi:hypothetical protein